jgi:hypothetical protein
MNVMIYSSVMWNRRIYLIKFVDERTGAGGLRHGSNRWAYIFVSYGGDPWLLIFIG